MIVIGDEVLQNGSIVCLSAGSAHWHMTLAQQQSFPDAAAPFSGFRFFSSQVYIYIYTSLCLCKGFGLYEVVFGDLEWTKEGMRQ